MDDHPELYVAGPFGVGNSPINYRLFCGDLVFYSNLEVVPDQGSGSYFNRINNDRQAQEQLLLSLGVKPQHMSHAVELTRVGPGIETTWEGYRVRRDVVALYVSPMADVMGIIPIKRQVEEGPEFDDVLKRYYKRPDENESEGDLAGLL